MCSSTPPLAAFSSPDQEDWERTREEIAINLEAPVHLSRLFIPHLMKQAHPAILNVTSGLSFAPLANVPVYCATKAALHSFTLDMPLDVVITAGTLSSAGFAPPHLVQP